MAVQPAQKGLFPVQIKAVRPEHSRPETEGGFPAVQYLPFGIEQLCYAAVEIRMLSVPRCGVGQRKTAFRRFCRGQLAAHQRLARTAAEPDAQRGGLLRCFNGQLYGSLGQCRCVHEKIAHTALRRGFKPDLPVQAAVGQIVDDKAEGRQAGVLARIQPHGQQVFCAAAHKVGNFDGEAGVAALMLPGQLAVQVDLRLMGGPVKAQEYPGRIGNGQCAAVTADHLIVRGVCVVERQLPAGMGQANRAAVNRFAPAEVLAPLLCKFPVITKTVSHRTNNPSSKMEIISSRASV